MALGNMIYNTAAKDGTFMGIVRGTVVQEEIYKNPAVHFESRKFHWIGNMNRDFDACVFGAKSGLKSWSDLYTREASVSGSGVGAQSYSFPIAYQKILGMKMKVIAGYEGTPDRMLAMERGELAGACGVSVSTFFSQVKPLADAGKVKVIAQSGLQKDQRFPDLPNMIDQAKTPEARQMLQLLVTPLALGRPLAAPPGTPADRVAVLRKAIMETLKDPEFLAEAKRIKIDIQPMDAAETAKATDAMLSAPPDVAEKLKQMVGG
jgi:tripartite-type tricarboxylate transporter receptor subunit TctC